MPYKSVHKRIQRATERFTIGSTRTIAQRNGVTTTVTKAVRDDGLVKRDITIFANGARVEKIRSSLREGMIVDLVGKWSQANTFVALDTAG